MFLPLCPIIFLATQNPGRFLIGISFLAVNLDTEVHSLLMFGSIEACGVHDSSIVLEEEFELIKVPSSFAYFSFCTTNSCSDFFFEILFRNYFSP
ncbi:unnamed protein product [Moneuplotes crassus]|uniref:Uncharacterized protein n=1 Tax=Euplotes crassus TaxID=5936 RepID=A0AAD1USZ3_EUPCR|nr:unnamed protein product [Moneuplotes crassus]